MNSGFKHLRGSRLLGSLGGLAALLAAGTALAQPRTLNDALAAAYANNPTLQAARAQLRATDEGVPQALAGWRPTVVVATGTGYGNGTYRTAGVSGTTGAGAPIAPRSVDVANERLSLDHPGHADPAALPRRRHPGRHQPSRQPRLRPARALARH